MSKRVKREYLSGNLTPEINNAVKHSEELAKINLKKITSTTSFIGVCASALFVIPFICSATIKPIMKKLDKRPETSETKIHDLKQPKKMLNTF